MPTVFVWEYASAAGPGEVLPEGIRTEGRAMLAAVAEDFARVEGVTVEVVHPTADDRATFDRLAAAADWTLVIAPESGGVLAERCRRVRQVGGRLLGPSPEAVELTADKLLLAEHLAARGVATPPCFALDEAVPFPAVLKPRDGAGSEATFLVAAPDALPSACAIARADGWAGELILQPFVPGQSVSVAFLIGPRGGVPLLPATQEMSGDGRFRYRGGRLPLTGDAAAQAAALASRAVGAVPGLMGYVGVDLVLGEQDFVIEINPRLTTSYVGLRNRARFNLAAAMLEVVSGRDPGPLAWRPGAVRFEPSGVVRPEAPLLTDPVGNRTVRKP